MADIHKITASVLNYGGSVEPTTAQVEQGEYINLSIRPKGGFDIEKVINNGDTVDQSEYPGGEYKFLSDRDCDVDIIFSKDGLFYYGIEIIKPEGGDIKLYDDGSGYMYMDDNIAVVISLSHPTFGIAPDDGYEVSDVMVDGSSVWFEGIDKYTFNEVRGNHTITATFKPKPQPTDTVIITASSNPENWGDTYGGGKYNVGDNVTMSAQPHSGYEFDCWTNEKGDVISTGSTFEFTADYDRTLIANFTAGGDMTPTQEAIYAAGAETYRNIMFQFGKMETLLMENKIGTLRECIATMERIIRRFGDTLRENGCD